MLFQKVLITNLADEKMLVEPKGVVNTGNTTSDLTSENDVWFN